MLLKSYQCLTSINVTSLVAIVHQSTCSPTLPAVQWARDGAKTFSPPNRGAKQIHKLGAPHVVEHNKDGHVCLELYGPTAAPPTFHSQGPQFTVAALLSCKRGDQSLSIKPQLKPISNPQGEHVNVTEVRLSSLEPYTLYRFRVRCRFATGLWSEWSPEVPGRTEEEGKEGRRNSNRQSGCHCVSGLPVWKLLRFNQCVPSWFICILPAASYLKCLRESYHVRGEG